VFSAKVSGGDADGRLVSFSGVEDDDDEDDSLDETGRCRKLGALLLHVLLLVAAENDNTTDDNNASCECLVGIIEAESDDDVIAVLVLQNC
jgi:hypothetical protein